MDVIQQKCPRKLFDLEPVNQYSVKSVHRNWTYIWGRFSCTGYGCLFMSKLESSCDKFESCQGCVGECDVILWQNVNYGRKYIILEQNKNKSSFLSRGCYPGEPVLPFGQTNADITISEDRTFTLPITSTTLNRPTNQLQ